LEAEVPVDGRAALTNQDRKFWSPGQEVLSWLTGIIPIDAKVLDIGPGTAPFSRADMFVDWTKPDTIPDHKFRACDIHRDRLPFDDKTFDFVYCRHVLEDLYNPFLIVAEMSRVAKAVYIETPSPLAEVCRGIDGDSPPWRGYHHHRFLIWNRGGILFFLTKYPIIEYLDFADATTAIVGRLRDNPGNWNSHFLWRDQIEVRYLQHEADYFIVKNYAATVTTAIKEGLESAEEFTKTMATRRSL
jgi:hypothetical protein